MASCGVGDECRLAGGSPVPGTGSLSVPPISSGAAAAAMASASLLISTWVVYVSGLPAAPVGWVDSPSVVLFAFVVVVVACSMRSFGGGGRTY